METEEVILKYLIEHGPQTTFRLASALGIKREKVVDILNKLAEERVVEFERGVAKALKKSLPKPKPRQKPKVKVKKAKPKKEIKKIKRFRAKPKAKIVKKKVTEEGPRIVRSVIKEVIPEEKLTELETRIKEKLKTFVEEAKKTVTSKTKELADTGLDITTKLKALEEKISAIEAKPLPKPRVIVKKIIPEELKERIEELTKKLEVILRVKKSREKGAEKIKPKPLPKAKRKSRFRLWPFKLSVKPKFKAKPLPKPKPEKIKKKKKVRVKLKLPKLKIPKIKIKVPKLFKLPRAKIKPRPKKTILKKIKKKHKGFFSGIKNIGKVPTLLSKKI